MALGNKDNYIPEGEAFGERIYRPEPVVVKDTGSNVRLLDRWEAMVVDKNEAKEWLYRELQKQAYRELHHIVFENDDGKEKERFAKVRKLYYEKWGEEFNEGDADENTPWEDTRHDAQTAEPAVEPVEPETAEEIPAAEKNIELESLKVAYAELSEKYVELLEKLNDLTKRLEA